MGSTMPFENVQEAMWRLHDSKFTAGPKSRFKDYDNQGHDSLKMRLMFQLSSDQNLCFGRKVPHSLCLICFLLNT